MTYTIYGLVDPRNNSVFYIGKTKKINRRIADHKLNEDDHSVKGEFINEIHNEYLEIDFVLLEECKSEKAAFCKEVFWIEIFRKAGNFLTNASIEYDGFYFLTEEHFEGKKSLLI